MDMKIGEVREFQGKKYRCEEGRFCCSLCDLSKKCENIAVGDFEINKNLGLCKSIFRKDSKNIIFIEVTE